MGASVTGWAITIGLTVIGLTWVNHNVRRIRRLHADGVQLGDSMSRFAVTIAARNLLTLIDRGAVGDVSITMQAYDDAIDVLRVAVDKATVPETRTPA